MSKIGKLPISIPEGIEVNLQANLLTISTPTQTFTLNLPPRIDINLDKNILLVTRQTEDKKTRSNHGAIRSIINNYITGLKTPWQKSLELIGTGYKVSVNADQVVLSVGYIKPVQIKIPSGLKVTTDSETKITISGADRVVVGQFASNIRKIRPPEPYKGKGIRYQGEFIKLKAGKTAKTSA